MRSTFTCIRMAGLLCLTLFILSGAFAQGKGTLQFKVRDQQTGFSIPDVKMQIFDTEGKAVNLEAEEKDGAARLQLSEGFYRFVFTAPGYDPMETYFRAADGETINARISMDPQQPTGKLYQRLAQQRITGDAADIITEDALVEGYVTDEAGKPLAEVTVATGNTNTQTDAQGYFQMRLPVSQTSERASEVPGLLPETFTLRFSKGNFQTHLIRDMYQVSDVQTVRVELKAADASGRNEISEETYVNGLYADSEPETPANERTFRNPFAKTQPNVITMPATIRVGTNCVSCYTCYNVEVLSLESYVEKGLDNEWISGWNTNSLKAGAVAYRTYGAYHTVYPYLNNPNYDITSNTCRQAWGATAYASTISATQSTSGIVLLKNGNFGFAEYSAENNNFGCGNGWSGTGSSYPCISDNVCYNYTPNGHGRGMCQWGSSRWANQGRSWDWIVDHYYTPGGFTRTNGGSSGSGTNLALNASVMFHSTEYGPGYSAWSAIDGRLDTKWTTNGVSPNNTMIINLNGSYSINKFVLKHASTGGEWTSLNTERFSIDVSQDYTNWTQVVNFYNSAQAGITEHPVNTTARYVRLNITDPGIDNYTRLPEFEVYAAAAGRVDVPGEEDQAAHALHLYPNPAGDYLNVEMHASEKLPVTLKVTNMRGIEVLRQQVERADGDLSLDIRTLETGTYLLTITGEKGQHTLRFHKK